AALTVPLALPFIFCLLLNVFSVLTTVSILGVILGVAALTIVLSVTSGFQQAFRDRVFGVNAHALVLKYGQAFNEYRALIEFAAQEKHVTAVAPFVFNYMMISHGGLTSGLLVKGIDTQLSPRVLDVQERLERQEPPARVTDLDVKAVPTGSDKPLPGIFLGKE